MSDKTTKRDFTAREALDLFIEAMSREAKDITDVGFGGTLEDRVRILEGRCSSLAMIINGNAERTSKRIDIMLDAGREMEKSVNALAEELSAHDNQLIAVRARVKDHDIAIREMALDQVELSDDVEIMQETIEPGSADAPFDGLIGQADGFVIVGGGDDSEFYVNGDDDGDLTVNHHTQSGDYDDKTWHSFEVYNGVDGTAVRHLTITDPQLDDDSIQIPIGHYIVDPKHTVLGFVDSSGKALIVSDSEYSVIKALIRTYEKAN